MEEARRFATAALVAVAEPEKSEGMQAYMTCTGCRSLRLAEHCSRKLARDFPPPDAAGYERLVLGLWDLPHREVKYLALGLARRFEEYVTPEVLPLYRRLIVEGAWWDLVDEVATISSAIWSSGTR